MNDSLSGSMYVSLQQNLSDGTVRPSRLNRYQR